MIFNSLTTIPKILLILSENEINSPESNDSGIQSDDINQSDFCHLYSTVNKPQTDDTCEKYNENIVHVDQHQLPLGWIRCCDDEGVIYYWHKPTGTVQRTPPVLTQSQQSISNHNTDSIASSNRSSISPVTSGKSSPSHQFSDSVYLNMSYHEDSATNSKSSTAEMKLEKEDNDLSSNSSHCSSNNDLIKFHRRFYVRSLGWVRISEHDLTLEKSSKAVNKCIHDLSHGFKDYNDVVARWGEGKDLFMDIEDEYLLLVDPIENKVLNKQAITSIRVWGVGRDNGRYV
jgi:amyloid beta (A4) precursor protein-binding family B protein 2 (Fe65-like)